MVIIKMRLPQTLTKISLNLQNSHLLFFFFLTCGGRVVCLFLLAVSTLLFSTKFYSIGSVTVYVNILNFVSKQKS